MPHHYDKLDRIVNNSQSSASTQFASGASEAPDALLQNPSSWYTLPSQSTSWRRSSSWCPTVAYFFPDAFFLTRAPWTPFLHLLPIRCVTSAIPLLSALVWLLPFSVPLPLSFLPRHTTLVMLLYHPDPPLTCYAITIAASSIFLPYLLSHSRSPRSALCPLPIAYPYFPFSPPPRRQSLLMPYIHIPTPSVLYVSLIILISRASSFRRPASPTL